jgi:hypothetical protein
VIVRKIFLIKILTNSTMVMMAIVLLLTIRRDLVLAPSQDLHLANVLLLESQTDRLPMYAW